MSGYLANSLSYSTYRDFGIVIGLNKGNQVAEIRSYDLRLQELTLSEAKQVLGEATSSHTIQGEDAVYEYDAGNGYTLKLVFPVSSKTSDPRMDHVNVLYASH